VSDALPGALRETRSAELRKAARALLLRPVLTATGPRRDDYLLVRKHARELTAWFGTNAGWRLTVDSEVARLRKVLTDTADATRPARDVKSGTPYTRRRYVVFALALSVLERAESQTTLGRLADSVVSSAADPVFRAAGIEFTLATREERSDMVAVVRLLIELGVLRRVAGSEDAFLAEAGDALYDIERRVLGAVLATPAGPSTVSAPSTHERLAALAEQPLLTTDELRNRHSRRSITRLLLDDPVLYYSDLSDDERAYLTGQRRAITDRITETTGLVAEVREEGIAMVDPDDQLTDLRMPEAGTSGHVTLLVAEHLAAIGGPTERSAVIDHVAKLAVEHRTHWRKTATEAGGEVALAESALDRLVGLGLLRRDGDRVHPLPALHRYAVGQPIRPPVAAVAPYAAAPHAANARHAAAPPEEMPLWTE
jgi:uncharacterized protein (TIGR02678 family)